MSMYTPGRTDLG